MKKILFLLLVCVASLSGCKKDSDEVNPDFAANLTGRYPLTYFRVGAQSVDLPTPAGQYGYFQLTRLDNTHVNAKLTIKFGINDDLDTQDLGDLELRNDTGTVNRYSAYYGSDKLGTISATEILFSETDGLGEVTEIRAKR